MTTDPARLTPPGSENWTPEQWLAFDLDYPLDEPLIIRWYTVPPERLDDEDGAS